MDDEKELLKLLEISLKKEGFKNIYTAENGKNAIQILEKEKIDIVILDVMLPDVEGYDICKLIRITSDMPVLFLSARGEEMDRIIGLAMGADDYVTKPFSIKEVVLRVKIRLQRSINLEQQKAAHKEEKDDKTVIAAGPFKIDKMKMEVKKMECQLI